jgi:hypothetical protein
VQRFVISCVCVAFRDAERALRQSLTIKIGPRNEADLGLSVTALRVAHSVGPELYAEFLAERACLLPKRIGILMIQPHTEASET